MMSVYIFVFALLTGFIFINIYLTNLMDKKQKKELHDESESKATDKEGPEGVN